MQIAAERRGAMGPCERRGCAGVQGTPRLNMLFWLLLLFIAGPLVELALLIEVGRHIGTVPTLVLIVATGAAGALLAKWQGLSVLRQIRRELAQGRLPGPALFDGLLVLMAGIVLLTPGLISDLFGFLCLIPATRRIVRVFLWRRMERLVRTGRARVVVVDTAGPPNRRDDRGGELP